MSQEYFYRAVLSIPLSLGKDLTTVKEDCLKARKYLESQNLEIDKITVETSTCSLLFKINYQKGNSLPFRLCERLLLARLISVPTVFTGLPKISPISS